MFELGFNFFKFSHQNFCPGGRSMEKIPAACAMDWSIQLEKGLRSPKPDKYFQAIEELGSRLEWWNSESELSSAAYRMFGLIPGEDKLFLNAIMLRLTDAFRLGNKQIKNRVVTLFLRMRRKGGEEVGILRKAKLENYLELLTRVKEVFDKGDAEERALALVLFGCWAYLAKDCADIRYIVLSSLVSVDVHEVKAGLFAARCLCKLSDHFAIVFLEVLATAVLSPHVSREIKLAGAKAFSDLGHSFSLADKAYKTGLKLLMDSLEDDFSAVMLISLTRVVSRWMLLVPSQIDLFTLFLSEERSLLMQVTAMRCLRFILAKGVCFFFSTPETVNKLFAIINRSELQQLQLEALRILHKILLFSFSTIQGEEIMEIFHKLLIVFKNMLKAPITSIRVLAVSILADLCGKVLGRADMTPCGTARSLSFLVVSFILDQILLVVAAQPDIRHPQFAAELEIKSLLHCLLNLVGKHPDFPCILLKNMSIFVENFTKMLNKKSVTEQTGMSSHEMVESDSRDQSVVDSNCLVYISQIAVLCLQTLEETNDETSQALDALKLQAENVIRCSYVGSYTSLSYFLVLQQHSSFICMHQLLDQFIPQSRNSSSPAVDSIVQLDGCALGCAKSMLRRDNYWYLYKAGKNAACHGAWSTAAFIFEQLIDVVQSTSCSSWLKSLSQFSNSERQIQLFLLPEQGTFTAPFRDHVGEMAGNDSRKSYHNYMENLFQASSSLLSAKEILASTDRNLVFNFQRWFMTLRGKVLITIVDMMKLLDAVAFGQVGSESGKKLEEGVLLPCGTEALGSLLYSSIEVSCRMKRLAQEFDLLLTSFMGMDSRSRITISALAFSCSLLAFTVGFAFLVPDLHPSEDYGPYVNAKLQGSIHSFLIDDLIGRLRHTDNETRKNLLLLKCNCKDRVYVLPGMQTQVSFMSSDALVLNKLCEYSVREILSLRNEATHMQHYGNSVSENLEKGSHLLLNIITKLMLIPFRTPQHFFRVRPAVSSELFVMNEDGKTLDGMSIFSGVPLFLNLCLQMTNTRCLPGKVCCILTCHAQPQMTIETGNCRNQAKGSWLGQEIDEKLDLNGKLWRYVIGSAETHSVHCKETPCNSSTVNEYMSFQLNDRGQGFSTCLLDTSSLLPGSYRIKWLSGCIDNKGSYWSLPSINAGPLFTVLEAKATK